MRCANHPEIITARQCDICDHYFCDDCLNKSAMGEACPACLPAVLNMGDSSSRPKKTGPPTAFSPLKLVTGVAYWLLVIAPVYAAANYTLSLAQIRAYIGLVYDEPRKLGRVVSDLVAMGAELEASQIEQGENWSAQGWIQNYDSRVDPYGAPDQSYQLAPIPQGWVLCSVGPDRMFDGGDPLDRFTGQGDLCLKVRNEDLLAIQ